MYHYLTASGLVQGPRNRFDLTANCGVLTQIYFLSDTPDNSKRTVFDATEKTVAISPS